VGTAFDDQTDVVQTSAPEQLIRMAVALHVGAKGRHEEVVVVKDEESGTAL
jgi:hypothetical protein